MTRSHHRRRNVAKKNNEGTADSTDGATLRKDSLAASTSSDSIKSTHNAIHNHDGEREHSTDPHTASASSQNKKEGHSRDSHLKPPPNSVSNGTTHHTAESKHTSEMIVPDLPSSPAPSDGENTRNVVHVHLPPFVHEEPPHDQAEEAHGPEEGKTDKKQARGEEARQEPVPSTSASSGTVSRSMPTHDQSPLLSPASSPELTESDTKFSTKSADALHESRLRTMFLLDQDILSDTAEAPDQDNEEDFQSVSLPDPAGRSRKRTYAFGHSTVISKSAPLNPGDEVRIRQGGKHTYYHHGIYIGNEKVVHVNGDFQSGFRWLLKPKYSVASVRCNTVSDFVGGEDRIKDIEVVHREFDASDNILHKTPADVVECAKACIDQPFNWNPLFHNCEHFATWCKYGPNGVQSTQITERDNWKKGIYSTWLWITVFAGLLKLVLLYFLTMGRHFTQWRQRHRSNDFNLTLIRAIADMAPQLQFRPMEITNHYYPKGYHVNPHSPVYRAQVAKAAKDVTGDVEKVITQIDDTANVIRKLTGSRINSPQPSKPPQCSSAPLPSASPAPEGPSLTDDRHHLRLPPASASLRSASAGIATV